jgi:hypothetical protein
MHTHGMFLLGVGLWCNWVFFCVFLLPLQITADMVSHLIALILDCVSHLDKSDEAVRFETDGGG